MFRKITAVLLIVTSVATWSVGPGFASEVNAPDPFLPMRIPQEFGKIDLTDLSENHLPALNKSQKLIVHIRDVHGSYEAQSNIEKILSILTEEYGFKEILLEGAPENVQVNPELLRLFPDQELNLKVADQMMKVGDLTGAEMFLLKHVDQKIFQAHGIENLDLYASNLKTYRDVIPYKTRSEQFIKKLNAQIEMVASKKFNKDLRDFVKTWSAWRNDQIDLVAFLTALRKFTEREMSLDLSHAKNQEAYPMLVRYFKARDLEPKIQLDQVKIEKEKFTAFLSGNSNVDKIKAMLSRWQPEQGFAGWHEQELPRYFLEAMYEQLKSEGFSFQDYPELSKAWGSLILQSELESGGLFDEIDRVNLLLFDRLARDEAEKQLSLLIHRAIMLDHLLRLELTREESVHMKAQADSLKPSEIFREIWKMGHGEESIAKDPHLVELDRIFRFAVQFYEQAVKREDAIIESVDRRLKAAGEQKAIVITGGFHSEGLEQEFKERGFSFLEITPRMTGVDGISKIYSESMLGTRRTIFDTAHIQRLLTMLPRETWSQVARLANMPDDIQVTEVLDAVFHTVGGVELLLRLNGTRFASDSNLSFGVVESLEKSGVLYLEIRSKGVELISIHIAADETLDPSQVKIPETSNGSMSQMDNIKFAIEKAGVGRAKGPKSWSKRVQDWRPAKARTFNQPEVVAAPTSLTQRSELRSDLLNFMSQGTPLLITIGVGLALFWWGLSLLSRSFNKNSSFSILDRISGTFSGSIFVTGSVVGIFLLLFTFVSKSSARTELSEANLVEPAPYQQIEEEVAGDQAQAPQLTTARVRVPTKDEIIKKALETERSKPAIPRVEHLKSRKADAKLLLVHYYPQLNPRQIETISNFIIFVEQMETPQGEEIQRSTKTGHPILYGIASSQIEFGSTLVGVVAKNLIRSKGVPENLRNDLLQSVDINPYEPMAFGPQALGLIIAHKMVGPTRHDEMYELAVTIALLDERGMLDTLKSLKESSLSKFKTIYEDSYRRKKLSNGRPGKAEFEILKEVIGDRRSELRVREHDLDDVPREMFETAKPATVPAQKAKPKAISRRATLIWIMVGIISLAAGLVGNNLYVRWMVREGTFSVNLMDPNNEMAIIPYGEIQNSYKIMGPADYFDYVPSRHSDELIKKSLGLVIKDGQILQEFNPNTGQFWAAETTLVVDKQGRFAIVPTQRSLEETLAAAAQFMGRKSLPLEEVAGASQTGPYFNFISSEKITQKSIAHVKAYGDRTRHRKKIIGMNKNRELFTMEIYGWDALSRTSPSGDELMKMIDDWRQQHGIIVASFLDGGFATTRGFIGESPMRVIVYRLKSRSELRGFFSDRFRRELWVFANTPLGQIVPKLAKRTIRRAYENAEKQMFQIASDDSGDALENKYFEKRHVIRSGSDDRFTKLSQNSNWHWIVLEGFRPSVNNDDEAVRLIAENLHVGLRLGGYAVFAHQDKSLVEKVVKEAGRIGFRVLPRGIIEKGSEPFSAQGYFVGRIYFVILRKVRLYRDENDFGTSYSNLIELVRLPNGKWAVKKSVPKRELTKAQELKKKGSILTSRSEPTRLMSNLEKTVDDKQERLKLLLKREKMLAEVKAKLIEIGKADIATRLPDVLDVDSSDQDLFMSFLREGVNPIPLSEFIFQSADVLDAIHEAGFVHGDPGHMNWNIGANGVQFYDFGTVRRIDEGIFSEGVKLDGLDAEDIERLKSIYQHAGPLGRGLKLDDPKLSHIKAKAQDPKYLMGPWVDRLGFAVMLLLLAKNSRVTSLLQASELDLRQLSRAAEKAVLELDQFKNTREIAQFALSDMGRASGELRSELRAKQAPILIRELPALLEKYVKPEEFRGSLAVEGDRALRVLEASVAAGFADIDELYRAISFYEQITRSSFRTTDSLSRVSSLNELEIEMTRSVIDPSMIIGSEQIALAELWRKTIIAVFPKEGRSELWNQSDSRNQILKMNSAAQGILSAIMMNERGAMHAESLKNVAGVSQNKPARSELRRPILTKKLAVLGAKFLWIERQIQRHRQSLTNGSKFAVYAQKKLGLSQYKKVIALMEKYKEPDFSVISEIERIMRSISPSIESQTQLNGMTADYERMKSILNPESMMRRISNFDDLVEIAKELEGKKPTKKKLTSSQREEKRILVVTQFILNHRITFIGSLQKIISDELNKKESSGVIDWELIQSRADVAIQIIERSEDGWLKEWSDKVLPFYVNRSIFDLYLTAARARLELLASRSEREGSAGSEANQELAHLFQQAYYFLFEMQAVFDKKTEQEKFLGADAIRHRQRQLEESRENFVKVFAQRFESRNGEAFSGISVSAHEFQSYAEELMLNLLLAPEGLESWRERHQQVIESLVASIRNWLEFKSGQEQDNKELGRAISDNLKKAGENVINLRLAYQDYLKGKSPGFDDGAEIREAIERLEIANNIALSLVDATFKGQIKEESSSKAKSELRLAKVELPISNETQLLVSEGVAFRIGAVASALVSTLIENAIATEPEEAQPVQITSSDRILGERVLPQLIQTLMERFNLQGNLTPRVVLDGRSSAAQLILRILPFIAPLAGEFGEKPRIEIYISNADKSFIDAYENMRAKSNLDAVGEGNLRKVLHFSSSSVPELTKSSSASGAGVFGSDSHILDGLEAKTYVTIADLSKFDDEQVKSLLIPLLMVTAVLGRQMHDVKTIEGIESLLNSSAIKTLLAEYGIDIHRDTSGRFIGSITQQVLETLVMESKALEELAHAA